MSRLIDAANVSLAEQRRNKFAARTGLAKLARKFTLPHGTITRSMPPPHNSCAAKNLGQQVPASLQRCDESDIRFTLAGKALEGIILRGWLYVRDTGSLTRPAPPTRRLSDRFSAVAGRMVHCELRRCDNAGN